jgi:hypothetical protein
MAARQPTATVAAADAIAVVAAVAKGVHGRGQARALARLSLCWSRTRSAWLAAAPARRPRPCATGRCPQLSPAAATCARVLAFLAQRDADSKAFVGREAVNNGHLATVFAPAVHASGGAFGLQVLSSKAAKVNGRMLVVRSAHGRTPVAQVREHTAAVRTHEAQHKLVRELEALRGTAAYAPAPSGAAACAQAPSGGAACAAAPSGAAAYVPAAPSGAAAYVLAAPCGAPTTAAVDPPAKRMKPASMPGPGAVVIELD